MGREVRMVPPNWEHPKMDPPPIHWKRGALQYDHDSLQPMYDQLFEDAAKEWREGFAAWERGERPDYCTEKNKALEYWEWAGPPPDRKYYRPWKDEEATWFQVWETVSEGTPVSPPFATRDELAAYLAENGDFWDQNRGEGGWGLERATAFCNSGWAPSFVVSAGTVTDGKFAVDAT